MADRHLAQINESIGLHTDVLGFVLRSTNVRNAFEVYVPLRRLVQQIVEPDARLITSSEWDFVPFTYPMTLDELPNYVLVGSPAPEAGNVLIVPLAGHELGHSAWRHHDLESAVVDDLIAAIRRAIDSDTTRRDELLQRAFGRKVRVNILQQQILGWALRHVEEIFCDFVGFYIFDEAYLWAFEYFLAPGSGDRNRNYPADATRIQYLREAANQLGMTPDPAVFASWRSASYPSDYFGDFLQITDEAVALIIPDLWLKAKALLAQLGVQRSNELAVKRVLGCFASGVPDGKGAALSEVAVAGWRIVRTRAELLDSDYQGFDALNELMLKSIEVSEYLLKVQLLNADEIAAALKPQRGGADRSLTIVPSPDLDALTKRGGASVDLRLGRWFRSFRQTAVESFSLVGPDPDRPTSKVSRTRQHFVPFGSKFVLHPGRFVLGATLEWLKLSGDLTGYVTGRSSLGRHGLIIETAAGIHPGFSGCLTLELANVGEVPLGIYPGMHICQIFFHRTTKMRVTAGGSLSGSRKPVLRDPVPDEIFRKLRTA